MKKILLFGVLSLGLRVWAVAQTYPEWVSEYGNDPLIEYHANDMVVDKSGNVYVTGYSRDTFYNQNCVNLKYSSYGTLLWLATISDAGWYSKIKIDAIGNAYVSVSKRDSVTGYDFYTVKYNPAGDTVWTAKFSGPQDGSDVPTSIFLDDSMNVYITGRVVTDTIGNFYGAFATVKYNENGVLQWSALYHTDYYTDVANDLTVDSALNVYVTGNVNDSLGFGIVTLKYNSNGVQQWIRKHHGDIFGGGHYIELFNNNYIYVGGDSSAPGWSDFIVIKYDLNGNKIWSSTFDAQSYNNSPWGNGWDVPYDMKIDRNGNVNIAGVQFHGIGISHDCLTVQFNSNGILQWANSLDGGYGWDDTRALAMDDSGNIYAACQVYDTLFATNNSFGTQVISTIVYDPTGNTKYILKYLQALHEAHEPIGVAHDSLGHIHIAGNTYKANTRNIIVFKYGLVSSTELVIGANEIIGFSLSPNPATNTVTVNTDETLIGATATITDITGRTVMAVELVTRHSSLVTSDFSSGVYFVTVTNKEGRNAAKKLVVQK